MILVEREAIKIITLKGTIQWYSVKPISVIKTPFEKKKEIKILISYVGRKLYPSSQIGAYDHGWLGVSLILVVFLVIKKCNKNIFIVQMQISKLSSPVYSNWPDYKNLWTKCPKHALSIDMQQ